MPKQYTLGDLAARYGKSYQQMKYAVQAYQIEPRGRLGIIRVWTDEDLPAIEAALRCIERHPNAKEQ